MKSSDVKDPYAVKPVLTADGKRWTQRCYVCSKAINFLKDRRESWVQIDAFVRHDRCTPPPLR